MIEHRHAYWGRGVESLRMSTVDIGRLALSRESAFATRDDLIAWLMGVTGWKKTTAHNAINAAEVLDSLDDDVRRIAETWAQESIMLLRPVPDPAKRAAIVKAIGERAQPEQVKTRRTAIRQVERASVIAKIRSQAERSGPSRERVREEGLNVRSIRETAALQRAQPRDSGRSEVSTSPRGGTGVRGGVRKPTQTSERNRNVVSVYLDDKTLTLARKLQKELELGRSELIQRALWSYGSENGGRARKVRRLVHELSKIV